MNFIEINRGDSPLVLGLPHTGTIIPEEIAAGLNETGRGLADTDWHIHDLYAGLVEGVSSVRTNIHRYAIDVNRDPQGVSLYPGQNTTTLCPLTDFDGQPIWQAGSEPDAKEIARRQPPIINHIMMRSRGSLSASKTYTVSQFFMIAIPSGPTSRFCLMENSLISISEQIWARHVRPRSKRQCRTYVHRPKAINPC